MVFIWIIKCFVFLLRYLLIFRQLKSFEITISISSLTEIIFFSHYKYVFEFVLLFRSLFACLFFTLVIIYPSNFKRHISRVNNAWNTGFKTPFKSYRFTPYCTAKARNMLEQTKPLLDKSLQYFLRSFRGTGTWAK